MSKRFYLCGCIDDPGRSSELVAMCSEAARLWADSSRGNYDAQLVGLGRYVEHFRDAQWQLSPPVVLAGPVRELLPQGEDGELLESWTDREALAGEERA